MSRAFRVLLILAAVVAAGTAGVAQGDGGYKLVPNWPHLPAGMYFGLKDAPPPPAEREAQAAAPVAAVRVPLPAARRISPAFPAWPSISTIAFTSSIAAPGR